MSARGLVFWVFAGAVLFAGCSSPEAGRMRGRGKGADTQNYGNPIEIHGPKDPYHATPDRSPVEVAAR